ncbi:hypothetical protein [Taibaiella chishuiensis]|uniref:Uncharacterized protein n=1 Tax=Taibaiella chishuiensis TaxID=1434707 RepID=A0A2P8D788_9BACT|nr:hypothetical protein [Taibaiella chishuiensis]PSK93095.1 hypothetical protein B0I18_10264 [Taibaiella chishuiensis]
MEEIKTVIIGAEYNKEVIDKLELLLLQEGAALTAQKEGVAGSQDYQCYQVMLSGSMISIELETYTGMAITGNAAVVDYLCLALQKQAT